MSWLPRDPGALKPVGNHFCPLPIHCESPRFWWRRCLSCLFVFFPCVCIVALSLHQGSLPRRPAPSSASAIRPTCSSSAHRYASHQLHSDPQAPAVLSPSVCWRFRNSFAFISILPVDLHHNLFSVCAESYQRARAVQTLLLCGFVVCRGRNKIGQSGVWLVLVSPELFQWFKYFSTLSVCEGRKWVDFPTWRNYPFSRYN